ncbi:MAG: tripartite tricarboxylate transporter permease [Akkermansiaceae bacterium]|nr:tripartite tricarboxylate transporter permease [Akkermansiaceae bacterium]
MESGGGGLVGTIALVLAAPTLAEFALGFSSFEYFWLALLGLSCAVFISTGSPIKGIVSVLLYASAIALAFVSHWLADLIFVIVPLMWLVPDRRIEKPHLLSPLARRRECSPAKRGRGRRRRSRPPTMHPPCPHYPVSHESNY